MTSAAKRVDGYVYCAYFDRELYAETVTEPILDQSAPRVLREMAASGVWKHLGELKVLAHSTLTAERTWAITKGTAADLVRLVRASVYSDLIESDLASHGSDLVIHEHQGYAWFVSAKDVVIGRRSSCDCKSCNVNARMPFSSITNKRVPADDCVPPNLHELPAEIQDAYNNRQPAYTNWTYSTLSGERQFETQNRRPFCVYREDAPFNFVVQGVFVIVWQFCEPEALRASIVKGAFSAYYYGHHVATHALAGKTVSWCRMGCMHLYPEWSRTLLPLSVSPALGKDEPSQKGELLEELHALYDPDSLKIQGRRRRGLAEKVEYVQAEALAQQLTTGDWLARQIAALELLERVAVWRRAVVRRETRYELYSPACGAVAETDHNNRSFARFKAHIEAAARGASVPQSDDTAAHYLYRKGGRELWHEPRWHYEPAPLPHVAGRPREEPSDDISDWPIGDWHTTRSPKHLVAHTPYSRAPLSPFTCDLPDRALRPYVVQTRAFGDSAAIVLRRCLLAAYARAKQPEPGSNVLLVLLYRLATLAEVDSR